MYKTKKNNKGFTLIELMVVLVILGILAGLIVPRMMGRTEDAKRVKTRLQIDGLGAALKLYKLDNGVYPTTEQGLEALVASPKTGTPPRAWREGGYLEKKKISPNRNQLIEDIMQYIAEHYSSPTLSVSTIAHAFSFNYHYLSKLFSQQTCINIKKYITKIRIHKAKEIIDTGSCSLQEVCFLVGYEDPSYFSKCFKAFYGVTPSQYVENRRRL